MQKMEGELALPDPKGDPKPLKEYFKKVVPNYDEEKVHVSDMKKMVKWYHLLKEQQLIPAEEAEAKETQENQETSEEEKREVVEEKTEVVEEKKKKPKGKKDPS
jgi:hypothetical protein